MTTGGPGDKPVQPRLDRPRSDEDVLDELESIRSLLDETNANAPAAPAGKVSDQDDDDADIPLLDDPIDVPAAKGKNTDTQSTANFDEFLEQELADQIETSLDDEIESALFEVLPTAEQDAVCAPPPGARPGAFDEDVIRSLLDDGWRDASARILATARRDIGAFDEPGELRESLRARLGREIEQWLDETLQNRMAELRRRLLAAMEEELSRLISNRDNANRDADQDR
jgi:hypothetical protein